MKYLYIGTGRDFSKIIKPLFYKNIISEAVKLNYVIKYILIDKKITKQKCNIVKFVVLNKDKFNFFLDKNDKFMIWEK